MELGWPLLQGVLPLALLAGIYVGLHGVVHPLPIKPLRKLIESGCDTKVAATSRISVKCPNDPSMVALSGNLSRGVGFL